MSLSDRDRKLMIFIVPVIIFAAYWFVVLAPVRSESSKLEAELAKQVQTRTQLQAHVAQLGQARDGFAIDYAAVVELGKAVPTSVDMPSLMVQLDRASHGTGIAFERIHAGDRLPADAAAGTGATGSGAADAPAAAAGGTAASTGQGKAVEKANDTKAKSEGSSTPTPPPAAGATSGVPGLDAVPLQFTFRGDFFNLADFFHRMKRFVHVVNDRVDVRGRLMTIESVELKAKGFPKLEAQVTAKVYLAPKTEGSTAGATPNGPATPADAGKAATPAPAASPPAAVIAR